MATRGSRDVSLNLSVETQTPGAEKLQGLAGDLQALAKGAGDGGPAIEQLAQELNQLSAASKAAAAAEAAAKTERTAARAALEAQRDALARLRAESTTATRATEAYQTAERTARLAIIESRAALREKSNALSTATAEARAAAAAERTLADQARATAAAMRAAGSEGVSSTTATSRAVEQLQGQLAALRKVATLALGGSLTGSLLKSVSDTADAVTNLQGRLKLVTGEGNSFATAWRGVQEVAQNTNSALESTGTLFARIAQAGKDMGVSQREALSLTETINQAVQLSGASAQASDAAITQLIQGLQSGVLRGEEFNSVMEQAPRLAQALAAGLGTTTGELRKMAEAGALTSQTVIGALRGQAEAVRTEYATLPPTVGRAIQQLSNAWSIYVSEASSATGASTTAAAAISALARNLDSVGTVLVSVGKAAAGYAALNLAKSFLDSATAAARSTAAKQAETAATVASTAATTANTAARVANNAATVAAGEAAATSAGKFAGLLSTLKTFSVIGIITNFREIGTAVGEGTAKLFGYGKASEELERRMKADEEATRRNADAKAALAQQTALATDKALGLSTEARKLVADFDQVRQKGDSTADALGKLTKALHLGDIKGIRDAGAALDALALRGKLAADDITRALSAALKGEDLLRFETQARAAFDSSTQGARRLQAALDAISQESLRRAGTSVEELRTGFNAVSVSALNDLDVLKRSLDELGARGEVAGRAINAALTKALDTANTTTAVQAVIDRIEALGKAGLLTGDQLAEAMTKAKAKLDDLRPGINSTEEAFRKLGVTGSAELARVAAASAEAWQRIKNDGTVALADKQRAFEAYAKTVTAMAGTEAAALLKIQGEALGLAVTFDQAGKAVVRSMSEAGGAIDDMRGRMQALGDQADQTARSLSSVYEAETKANSARVSSKRSGATYDAQGFATDSSGNRITAGTFLPAPTRDGPWEWVPALNQGYDYGGYWRNDKGAVYTGMNGGPSNGRGLFNRATYGAGTMFAKYGTDPVPYQGGSLIGDTAPTPTAAAPSPAPAPAYTVNVNLAGKRTAINTASASDQSALVALLSDLEKAAGVSS